MESTKILHPGQKISIIVPAYNEEAVISDVVMNLSQAYPTAEIIVVNDGSHDKTKDIVSALDCVFIDHKINRGYGASWKSGLRKATGDVVVFYDGDGQFEIHDVKRCVDVFQATDADMVSGSRGSGSDRSLTRVPGKWILKQVSQILHGQKIPDLNCGLRVVRRSVLLRYMHLLPNGFSASTTSLMIFLNRGYVVQYCEIKTKARLGTSSVNMISDGFGTVLLLIRMIALFNPLRVFGPVSLALILFSFVYSILEVITKGLGIPVLGATLFTGGMLTFMVGIVCDQISFMRLEQFETARLEDEE